MRRRMILPLLLIILSVAVSMPAAADYWPHDSSHAVSCAANHPACQVLQMVMMGCFDYVEAPDSLDERVLSAVLPKLLAVEEAEFAHFCEEFSVEETEIRQNYFTALSNCLLSDIRLNPNLGGNETLVRKVLKLFLDPAGEENSEEQMMQIRQEMTNDLAESMAQTIGVPKSFIITLIGDDAAVPET